MRLLDQGTMTLRREATMTDINADGAWELLVDRLAVSRDHIRSNLTRYLELRPDDEQATEWLAHLREIDEERGEILLNRAHDIYKSLTTVQHRLEVQKLLNNAGLEAAQEAYDGPRF